MKVKALLLTTFSLFLFSSFLSAMEENNFLELPLLEEIALLHSSTISLLDTNAWNPTIEQEMQPISELEALLFTPDDASCIATEEQAFWYNTVTQDEKQPTNSVKKFYICSYCSRTFKYMSLLKVHERKHTGDKPFACDHPNCGHAYAQMGDLNRHKKTHTDEKSFICDYPNCNYAFAKQDILTLHQRSHTGEKPYKCDYPNCNYAFARNSHLSRHKQTHTGEKPYQCDHPHCGYASVRRSNLTTHQRTHTSKRDAPLITINKAINLATKKAKLSTNNSK